MAETRSSNSTSTHALFSALKPRTFTFPTPPPPRPTPPRETTVAGCPPPLPFSLATPIPDAVFGHSCRVAALPPPFDRSRSSIVPSEPPALRALAASVATRTSRIHRCYVCGRCAAASCLFGPCPVEPVRIPFSLALLLNLGPVGSGVVSVMALSSLFILMTLHGLEYPYFYEQMLASCLKSYLLLAYLAAAFAKKLHRLALSVLPAEALVIVAPFHNLLRWHPSIKCLVHRVLSVMALSSLFILLKQHGLEYTYFNEKLSALLQPSVFIAKHRAKFYELLVSCLKSPLLPAYLAAAFAKTLSRLALSVLRAGALVIVSPIHNLFRRHPSINCSVHREPSKRMSTRSLFYFHRGRLLLLLAFVLSDPVTMALGDKGIASYYTPPYERTDCYGVGSSQFPENKLFAAAGDRLWDLGAACGREYEVRCISKAQSGPGSCKPGSGTIRVKIVDSATATGPKQSVTGADLVLSQTAFEAIANPSVASINVEFKEV
ncbi:hypothetical protein NL676_038260 [Syzygium grande]|nr:hypothetical protein NL676_038260 [Syzygium grande]